MIFFKGRLMQITFYLFLAIIIYAVAVRFAEFQSVLYLLKRAKPVWIAVALALQAATYAAAGEAMRQIARALGYRFSLWYMYRLDLALLFLSHTIPSGAFTGVLYMIRAFKRRGLTRAEGTTVSLILLISGYMGFFVLLLVGLLALPSLDQSGNVPLAYIVYALAAVLGIFILLDRMIVKREFVGRCFHFFLRHTRLHSRLERRVRQLQRFFDELADGRKIFVRKKRKVFGPVIYQFTVLLLDCLTLLTIFYAFGLSVSLTVIIFAYAVGRFLGAVSLLPGGLGSFDAAQILALKALGVPLPAATLATLVFRLFAYWIPTPIGLYYYRRLDAVSAVSAE